MVLVGIVSPRDSGAAGQAGTEGVPTMEPRDGQSGPLTGVSALAHALAGPVPPVLLDVRWRLGGPPGIESYRAGHLPGALFVDLETELAAEPGPAGRHPLPSPGRFEAAMHRAGVRTGSTVVAYDEADGTAAARAWWLLRYFGHPAVAVLDGGLAAWVRGGNPLEPGAPRPQAGDFVARPGGMPVLSATEAGELPERGILLDARAPERFAGLAEPIDPVAGHIPGARNRPTTENVAADGRFLEAAALRAAFEELGVRQGIPVAAYCGSGVTAAHEVLALELAGISGALYPGSWSEWITDPARPVAR